ncbi:MAG: hypothetical protein V5A22_07295 [Salinivenus sp.]
MTVDADAEADAEAPYLLRQAAKMDPADWVGLAINGVMLLLTVITAYAVGWRHALIEATVDPVSKQQLWSVIWWVEPAMFALVGLGAVLWVVEFWVRRRAGGESDGD